MDSEKAIAAYEKSVKSKRKSRRKIIIITAIITLLVLIVNIAFSILSYKYLLFTDLTTTRYNTIDATMYRLTDATRELIAQKAIPMIDKVNSENGGKELKLNIIFCADPDLIEEESLMRYISYTAREIEKEFPDHINVDYVNIEKNPTAVQKYKVTSAANIYPSNVIIEFGSEFTVLSYKSFFTANSDSEAPWAYNGEKRFASSILSVTRAESPICCITTNHGEDIYLADGSINPNYTAFVSLIKGAGYDPQPINLETDTIPEDCRMIITFNPKEDFRAFGNLGDNGISEIQKLDKFLDGSNSFMYIADPDTPALENLDEYLEEWGVKIARENIAGTSVGQIIRDDVMNTDENGYSVLGQYATEGRGASICEDLLSLSYPPKVVFPHTGYIALPDSYTTTYVLPDEEEGVDSYEFYKYYKNGVSRNMFNIFSTYENAVSMLDGKVYDMASADKRLSLMTLTEEVREIQEDSYNSVNNASYVIAAASTEFFSNDALNSKSYGNTDVLLSALRHTSREIVPVNINIKPFYIYDIQQGLLTRKQATTYMLVLAIVPSVIILGVGAVVCIKRKNK